MHSTSLNHIFLMEPQIKKQEYEIDITLRKIDITQRNISFLTLLSVTDNRDVQRCWPRVLQNVI